MRTDGRDRLTIAPSAVRREPSRGNSTWSSTSRSIDPEPRRFPDAAGLPRPAAGSGATRGLALSPWSVFPHECCRYPDNADGRPRSTLGSTSRPKTAAASPGRSPRPPSSGTGSAPPPPAPWPPSHGGRTVHPVRQAWSTGAEVAGAPWQTRRPPRAPNSVARGGVVAPGSSQRWFVSPGQVSVTSGPRGLHYVVLLVDEYGAGHHGLPTTRPSRQPRGDPATAAARRTCAAALRRARGISPSPASSRRPW